MPAPRTLKQCIFWLKRHYPTVLDLAHPSKEESFNTLQLKSRIMQEFNFKGRTGRNARLRRHFLEQGLTNESEMAEMVLETFKRDKLGAEWDTENLLMEIIARRIAKRLQGETEIRGADTSWRSAQSFNRVLHY